MWLYQDGSAFRIDMLVWHQHCWEMERSFGEDIQKFCNPNTSHNESLYAKDINIDPCQI
jgi:hypothetical protein